MNIDRNMDSIDSNNAYNSISSSSIATNNNNNNNVNNINTSSNSNNFNNNNNSNNISNIGNVRGNAIDDSVVNSRKSYQANASEEDADEYGEGGVATNEANIRRASHEQPSSLVRSDINDLRGARYSLITLSLFFYHNFQSLYICFTLFWFQCSWRSFTSTSFTNSLFVNNTYK